MTPLARAQLLAAACSLCAVVSAQQPAQTPPEQPRFRAGANLVRVDAYVTRDGQPVGDLTADDFEVIEDNAPQRVESFEVIRPRAPGAQSARREPNTVAESREMAGDANARVFVLFMDVWHVSIDGSYRAQNPITKLLDRVIGQDDLVGIMTPEMSARNLTLARRTETITGILRDNWTWGQRDRLTTPDPAEQQIEICYPDSGATAGIAAEINARRRESKTLDAVEDLVVHLESVREERKFVVLLSEGWLLFRRNDHLARVLTTAGEPRVPGGPTGVGVEPNGRLTTEKPEDGGNRACERQRSLAAFTDNDMRFHHILQRANRANVSFYPVDARGLLTFDSPMSAPQPLAVDSANLRARVESLRTLAADTDGVAIVDTSAIARDLDRMVADTGVYYLLGYYSTNTKLDGKFRRLKVRLRKPGMDVRARPGYLAPTEADAAMSRVDRLVNGGPAGYSDTPPELRRAIETLTPARGIVPLRIQAAAAPGRIFITTELDATIAKAPEWSKGGQWRVVIEHATGAAAPIVRELALAAGERITSLIEQGVSPLPPGRYVLRLALTPNGGTLPLQTTVDVVVPEKDALLGGNGFTSRRGPQTGLQYVATADARYQRTERIRFEVPRGTAAGVAAARLLNRAGQPLPLTVALSERTDDTLQLKFIVADLQLAALAQGEYILEVTVEKNGATERAVYAFRVVP
jgi:VWFA-related protein